jgi:hypothetical protein
LRYNYNNFENVILPVTSPDKSIGELRIRNTNWRSGTNYITPQITTQVRNQVRDDVTLTRGVHTFRFGGNWERTAIGGQFAFAKPSRVRLNFLDSAAPAPTTEAEFLALSVRDVSFGIGNDILPFNTKGKSTINHRFQVYGTDQWKLTPKFTLNLGLAYRYDTNLYNTDLPRPAIIAPLFPRGAAAPPNDKNNIAPRVGFAWDMKGNGRTVIRGGVGMYYDTTIDNLRLFERADLGKPGAELFLVGNDVRAPSLVPFGGNGRFGATPGDPSGYITLGQLIPLLPQIRKELETIFSSCTLPTSIECGAVSGIAPSGPIFSNKFQIPYSIQYAIGFQRELPLKMLLQADFNYRKGVHEIITYDVNLNDALDANGNSLRRSSFPNSVPYADSSGFSTYKALLVRLDRRFASGFQMTASYSLSRFKAFGGDQLGLGDTPSNLLNLRADYGPAALDRTHKLVVSAIWELPYFKKSSSAAKRNVLGGWTVSLISTTFSGLPMSALLPNFADLSGTGTFISYLPGTGPGAIGRTVRNVEQLNNLIRNYNANLGKYAANPAVAGCFPCDIFGDDLLPLAEQPSDTPIGGDSLISQDIRITKGFRFGESKRLDLIGEVFNLFNIANLSTEGTQAFELDPTGTARGEFTAFRPTARSSSVFGTGGPRAFQFAVKFTF